MLAILGDVTLSTNQNAALHFESDFLNDITALYFHAHLLLLYIFMNKNMAT